MSLSRRETSDRDKLHSSRRVRISKLFHRVNGKSGAPSIAPSDGSDPAQASSPPPDHRRSISYRFSHDVDNISIRTRASKNLWLQAWEELARDEPTLRLYTPDGREDPGRQLPHELLDAVRKDLRDATGRRSTLLKKIADYVDVFIRVGDRSTSFDLTGYAMLPWAAIQFLYQASLRNLGIRDVILDALIPVVFYLAWCRIREAICNKETLDSVADLKIAFRNVYKALLKYLVSCQTCVQESSNKQALRSLLFMRASDDFKILIECFSALKERADDVTLQSSGDVGDSLKSALAKAVGLSVELDSLDDDLEATAIEQDLILRLSAPANDKYYDLHEAVTSGVWLQTNPKVGEFFSSPQSEVLWLHGPQGTGKTTLLSTLIAKFRQGRTRSDDAFPIHFYCSNTDTTAMRADAARFLRSLLSQLLQFRSQDDTLDDIAQDIHTLQQAGVLSTIALSDLVIRALNSRDLTYIFLDAIDECSSADQESILACTRRILNRSESIIKFFVTSDYGQFLSNIFAQFQNLADIPVGPVENNEDIKDFASFQTEETVRIHQDRHDCTWDDDVKVSLHKYLSDNAMGSFSWLQAQSHYIQELKAAIDIKAYLECPAPDLFETYREIYAVRMGLLPLEERTTVQHILEWLLVAQTPLSLDQLLDLVDRDVQQSKDITSEKLKGLLGGFINFDGPTMTFAHSSVREFFETLGNDLEYPIIVASGHEAAACTCLSALLDSRSIPASVIEYARQFWQVHSQVVEASAPPKLYATLSERFLHPRSEAFRMWCKEIRETEPPTAMEAKPIFDLKSIVMASEPHPLLIACRWNLPQSLNFILPLVSLDEIKRLQSTTGKTALHLAAQHGYTSIMTKLISKGIDLNPLGDVVSLQHYTPLQLAIQANNIETVKWLVAKGARVDLLCYNPETLSSMTALSLALWLGHENISRFLFKVSDLANLKQYDDWLLYSTNKSLLGFAQDFIDRGADINVQRKCGSTSETPLSLSARAGHEKIVQLLLKRGASVNVEQALLNAVTHSHAKIVDILLTARPNAATSTILTAAAGPKDHLHESSAKSECLRVLLAHGMDPNKADASGHLPLHRACRAGQLPKITLLLDNRADSNAQDSLSDSAINAALSLDRGYNSQSAILNALLEHGARIDQGSSSLATAIKAFRPGARRQSQHLSLAEYLLARGADVDCPSPSGLSPLHEACLQGDARLVKLLLKAGATVGRTLKTAPALCGALAKGHEDVIEVLFAHGARIDPADKAFGEALVDAAENGALQQVKTLINAGIHVDSGRSSDRMTALCGAARHGSVDVVRTLLEAGARIDGRWYDPDMKDHLPGLSPLIAALEALQGDATKLLVTRGADVNVQCHLLGFAEHDRSALMIACMHNRPDLVRLLLDHGAKSNTRDISGRTALHYAVEYADAEVIHLLIDHKIDRDASTAAHGSALQWALVNPRRSLSNFTTLLEAGADANIGKGVYGSSLQAAAYFGLYEQASQMIKRGASVNKTGGKYGSPLHAVARSGYVETASLLIAHGAEVNATGGRYGSPLMTALLSGHKHVAALLMAHGAHRGRAARNWTRTGGIRDDDAKSVNAEAEIHVLDAAKLCDELYPNSERSARKQAAVASFENFSTMW